MSVLISGGERMRQEQKTTRVAKPEQLRQERQRRGWSRVYIAEQIGLADPKTIGRWERGLSFPSAAFLQKLCALFAMPAEELGLWLPFKERSQPARSVKLEKTITPELPGSLVSQTTRHPFVPPPVADEYLVGRDKLVAQLKACLC